MKKNKRKFLLAAVSAVILLALCVAAGFQVPSAINLERGGFSGASEENGAYYPVDWDETLEMPVMQTPDFPAGQDELIIGYTAEEASDGKFQFLDEEGEILDEQPFMAQSGTHEISLVPSPTAVSARIVTGETTGLLFARTLKSGILNFKWFTLTACFGAALWMLAVFCRPIAKKPEYGFLIVALSVIIIFLVWVPAQRYILWDILIHERNTEDLARFGMDTALRESLADFSLSDAGYLPGAIGMRLALLFTDDMAILVQAARITTALMYLATGFYAVRMAVRYKMIFAIAALAPTALLLAPSVSYDVMVNGMMFLSLSLMMTEMLTPHERLCPGRAVLIMLSFLLSCLPKAVYVPMILILLFLPREKFATKKQSIAFRLSVLAVFISISATFVLPMLVGGGGGGDARGGNVDPSAQMHYILSNPIGYTGLLLKHFADSLWPWLRYMAMDYAYLGSASTWLSVCFLLMLCLAALTDYQTAPSETPGLPLWKKAILFLCILASAALVSTAMFIAFTEPGKTFIAGVQARYFLTVLPAVLILVQPGNLIKKRRDTAYPTGLLAAALIVNFMMLYQILVPNA